MIKPYDVSIEVAFPQGTGNQDDARAWLKEQGWPIPPYSGKRTEPTGVTKDRGNQEDPSHPEDLDVYVFSPYEL